MALALIASSTKTHGMSDLSPEVVELDPQDAIAVRGDVAFAEMPTATVVVEAGFPVSKPVEAIADAHSFVLPGGPVVQVVHVGPYETMEETYVELQAWMDQQGLHPAVGMWECYLSDPRTEPDPATRRTKIIWPIT